jgi:hypothetical protein
VGHRVDRNHFWTIEGCVSCVKYPQNPGASCRWLKRWKSRAGRVCDRLPDSGGRLATGWRRVTARIARRPIRLKLLGRPGGVGVAELLARRRSQSIRLPGVMTFRGRGELDSRGGNQGRAENCENRLFHLVSPSRAPDARQRAPRINAAQEIAMAWEDCYDRGHHEAASKFLDQEAVWLKY